MRVGDLLEIAGGGCLVAAGYLRAGLWVALIVAGVVLVYEAQGFGATPLRLPKRK